LLYRTTLMAWMLSEHIQAMRVDVSRDSTEYELIFGRQHNNKNKPFELLTLVVSDSGYMFRSTFGTIFRQTHQIRHRNQEQIRHKRLHRRNTQYTLKKITKSWQHTQEDKWEQSKNNNIIINSFYNI
jgi:hypothetical protein